MLTNEDLQLCMRYMPRFLIDRLDPFPIKSIGCTVWREKGCSSSFRDLTLDPAALGAELVIEYALYFDYDIQHLYDLEHAWVAVDAAGRVTDCWGSFHGARFHVSGVEGLYRMEEGLPVLYIQPGKHAIMPEPRLFGLHSQCHTCCNETAGGGLLVPPFLRDRMSTNPEQDMKIRQHIRDVYSFTPTWEFIPDEVKPEQLMTWPELRDAIPGYVAAELQKIGL